MERRQAMIRYLVEVGLGVRQAPMDKIDWYLEPCARLAFLYGRWTKSSELRRGTAEGLLVVVESILIARQPAIVGEATD